MDIMEYTPINPGIAYTFQGINTWPSPLGGPLGEKVSGGGGEVFQGYPYSLT